MNDIDKNEVNESFEVQLFQVSVCYACGFARLTNFSNKLFRSE